MNIYSKYSRLIFLVGLLFLGGRQLFAAAEVQLTAQEIKSLQKEGNELREDIASVKRRLVKKPDDAALTKRLDGLQEEFDNLRDKLRSAGAATIFDPKEGGEEISAEPTQKGSQAQSKPKPAKPAEEAPEYVETSEVKAAVLKLAEQELKDLRGQKDWERLSRRAGFFIEEGKDFNHQALIALATTYKTEADENAPASLANRLSMSLSVVTVPARQLAASTKALVTGAAGKVGSVVATAAEAVSDAWRYYVTGSSGKI